MQLAQVKRLKEQGVQSRSVMAVSPPPSTRTRYGTDTTRKRHDHSRRQSCDTAIEGFGPRAERALQTRPRPPNAGTKHLEKENARLKKAAAELTLDKLIPKEAAEGNY